MELTTTHHMVDDVQPQDEVMDQFRKLFPLVADCYVSKDGMMMSYQMKTLSGGANSLNDAKRIINANNLPLSAGMRVERKGLTVKSVELRIVYKTN